MKKQLFLLLALLVACDTIYAADGLFDRKKARKRRKAHTEQVADTAQLAPAAATPVAATPSVVEETPAEVVLPPQNDITLNFTPEQADSLVAAWHEYRQQRGQRSRAQGSSET